MSGRRCVTQYDPVGRIIIVGCTQVYYMLIDLIDVVCLIGNWVKNERHGHGKSYRADSGKVEYEGEWRKNWPLKVKGGGKNRVVTV